MPISLTLFTQKKWLNRGELLMTCYVLEINVQFVLFLTFTWKVTGVQLIKLISSPIGIIQHNLWTKTKRGSSTRDSEKGLNNLEWNIFLKNLAHFTNRKTMIHKVAHFAAYVLNNPYTLGPLCMALVFVPIIGMHLVHKYGWEHWEPFNREPHS